jgi:hypothetical protein
MNAHHSAHDAHSQYQHAKHHRDRELPEASAVEDGRQSRCQRDSATSVDQDERFGGLGVHLGTQFDSF